eukprot:COSAG02_NODE_1894_length_10475_cov_10.204125_10_plen_98_part_00
MTMKLPPLLPVNVVHVQLLVPCSRRLMRRFYDTEKSTLYLIPNATAAEAEKPPAGDYIAVLLETLISINGTKDMPVKDVTIQGITFRDAADITMEPW